VARAARFLPAAPALALLLALAGCAGDRSDQPRSSTSSSAAPTPALGGPPVVRATPPDHEMDRLERPVAVQLARQVAREGLTLQYLDCPRWDGRVPSRMSCRAFVDGLRTEVDVVFTRAVQGKAVGFDASLARGVIATRNLERTLRRQGWSEADCGDVPAYPARPGSRIVCRVTRTGSSEYVVATVRDHAGAVTIAGYRGSTASP
jgi:hypothetical protein